MRTGLEKLEGVEKVDVSLEKGYANIELKPENKITLSEIQTVIKKNGFSPKRALVKLHGKVGDKQITITKSNESVPAVVNPDQTLDPEDEYFIEGNLVIQKESSQLTVSSAKEKL